MRYSKTYDIFNPLSPTVRPFVSPIFLNLEKFNRSLFNEKATVILYYSIENLTILWIDKTIIFLSHFFQQK